MSKNRNALEAQKAAERAKTLRVVIGWAVRLVLHLIDKVM